MIITNQGLEFFKVQFGDTILAFNPISKESKLKASRFGSDVALISLNHPDTNGAESVTYSDREPMVISGPGEYEVKEVFIKGFSSQTTYGGKERINTVYFVTLEGMNICFLGAIGDKTLSKEAQESLENVDILFVPIGGEGVLDAEEAYKFSVSLEPKIIIPMHYDLPSAKGALAMFLKEAGEDKTAPIDKLTIKKKDLEGKDGEVIVLASVN